MIEGVEEIMNMANICAGMMEVARQVVVSMKSILPSSRSRTARSAVVRLHVHLYRVVKAAS